MLRRLTSAMLCIALLTCTLIPALAEAGFEMFIGEGTTDTTSDTSASEALPEGVYEVTDEDEDPLDALETSSITDYHTLQLGDQDEDGSIPYIVTLQARLMELGYLGGGADGQYGSRTEAAVKSFQQSNSLNATGIADPVTQQVLYSDKSGLVLGTAIDTSANSGSAYMIQTKLSQWGFLEDGADGVIGTSTQKGISLFKGYVMTYYGYQLTTPEPTVAPTPIGSTPDPNKLPDVNDVLLPTPVPKNAEEQKASSDIDNTLMTYVNGETEFILYRETLQSGDTGDEVKRVQRRLKNLKYLYKIDGAFGLDTVRSLMYFQTKNGLPVTGEADRATQELLFSGTAIPSEEYVFPYKIIVEISEQRTYVYGWDGTSYSKQVKKMKCSTGKDGTPTPTGTYQASGPTSAGEWYYFKKFNCYAKWATRIVGGILFHSVTYSSRKVLNGTALRKLGRKASHGCIRLTVEDSKWIYDNCPAGTTVVIRK